jgi:hypothetical protein
MKWQKIAVNEEEMHRERPTTLLLVHRQLRISNCGIEPHPTRGDGVE